MTVAGDAGVGKTRLVRELWEELAATSPEPLRRTGPLHRLRPRHHVSADRRRAPRAAGPARDGRARDGVAAARRATRSSASCSATRPTPSSTRSRRGKPCTPAASRSWRSWSPPSPRSCSSRISTGPRSRCSTCSNGRWTRSRGRCCSSARRGRSCSSGIPPGAAGGTRRRSGSSRCRMPTRGRCSTTCARRTFRARCARCSSSAPRETRSSSRSCTRAWPSSATRRRAAGTGQRARRPRGPDRPAPPRPRRRRCRRPR